VTQDSRAYAQSRSCYHRAFSLRSKRGRKFWARPVKRLNDRPKISLPCGFSGGQPARHIEFSLGTIAFNPGFAFLTQARSLPKKQLGLFLRLSRPDLKKHPALPAKITVVEQKLNRFCVLAEQESLSNSSKTSKTKRLR
jgi:hypothetical protein